MVKNTDNAKHEKMTNDSEINKKKSKEIARAVKKEEKAEDKIVEKAVDKVEEGKETIKEAEKEIAEKIEKEVEKVEDKKEQIKEKKKKVEKKVKKTEVVVNGRDLRISTKQAVAICNLIRGKDIDKAIGDVGEVIKMKRAVPIRGEIPHRKGKIMSGRYPIKASEEFVKLLRSLRANAINHEVELEKVRISCMANVASRPYRRFGQSRFKRSHVQIRLVPFEEKKISKVDFSNKSKSKLLGESKQMKEIKTLKSEKSNINNKIDVEDE